MQKLTKFLLLFILTACNANDKHQITSIPEASGISYCQDSNTLMVANDEGTFYELTTTGAILLEHKLGNYDLEGVVCEENIITFAVEDGALLQIDRKTMKKKVFKVKSDTVKLNKPMGIEGIIKIKDLYYLAIQANKKKESNLLVVKLGINYAKITNVIELKTHLD